MKLDTHPTVLALANRAAPTAPDVLDAGWLREVALNAGADDVGFVALDTPGMEEEAEELRKAFPAAHSLLSFVVRMNRESVRSPLRSVANRTFHDTGERAEHVADQVARLLEDAGVKAINPSMAFPMEMDRFPGRIWIISHKRVAEAAGLGKMGLHRNLIHPRFGNFILLGTVAVDRAISEAAKPLDYSPCLGCNLCVSACPVGAVKTDGGFDFQACYTHNYREFMGGFMDILGEVAAAKDRADLERRVPLTEGVSLWQSLTYKANYKAAYCMSVCPAGEDVIGPYLEDRKRHVTQYVKPLREKEETLFVLRGSDAEAHASKRYPHKPLRYVKTGIQPSNIDGFLRYAGTAFQPGRSKDVEVRLHFTFTGASEREATLDIRDKRLEVLDGHIGERDAHVTVDATTWLGIVAGEVNPVWAVIRGRMKVKGPVAAMSRFQSCFVGGR